MTNRLDKLLNTEAKPKTNNSTNTFSILSNKLNFPGFMEATTNDVNLKQWIVENRALFDSKLLEHGALLFRNFKIDSVDKFQDLIKIFAEKPLEYKMRSSPRYSVGDNVYHTTTYPAEYAINMHSESSYDPNHPSNIVFCCVVPADEQGETPIADNRLVLKYLTEKTRKKFEDKGVKYVRSLNKSLGLPWQEVFQTSDKDEVVAICKEKGISCEWIGEEKLMLRWTKKAIWDHPITGDRVWFNHGYFFNKHNYDEDFLSIISSDDDLPSATYYGDGLPISKEEISEIREAYERAKFEFSWEPGDVLFLDNMLMSHGRNPYKGNRKIIASIF